MAKEKLLNKGKVVIGYHEDGVWGEGWKVGVIESRRTRKGYKGSKLIEYKVKWDGGGAPKWESEASVIVPSIYIGKRVGQTVGVCDQCGDRVAVRECKLSRSAKTIQNCCGDCAGLWNNKEILV